MDYFFLPYGHFVNTTLLKKIDSHLQTFKNGSAARIEVLIFHELYNTLKDGTIKDTIRQIIHLQENGSIVIINLKLSNLL